MDTMTVANTILEQLGGSRFIAMTGASNFLGSADSLQFKLPARSAKQGINLVKVTLEPSNLYRVTFYKYRSLNVALVTESAGVYASDLGRLITRETGLELSL